jgi:hypothetical protein
MNRVQCCAASWWAAGVVVATLVAGCDGNEGVRASPPTATAERSACDQAFVRGRRAEAAGTPSFEAFLPSVQTCSTLAEWTTTAQELGRPLRGQEATFVSNVCAEADAATQALAICTEAERRFRAGG